MKIARNILTLYRFIQYKVFGRYLYGAMPVGVECKVSPFRFEENHGDIVHPCIRYIPEGHLGHQWWMVYSPYYRADSSLENPILCYSDENNANCPPTEWKVFVIVNEKPIDGYNSDPTLLYKDGELYVFWRENFEKGNHPFYRATFAAKVISNGIERIPEPLLRTDDAENDAETSPCFIPTNDNEVMAYGMHLRFHSPRIKRMRPVLKKWVNSVVLITELIGAYSQQKHYGLAIWEQKDNWLKPYKHVETIKFMNCNRLYRPWHMDFFDWQGKRYCVVQTNQCNADIALAVSEDEKHFAFFKKPLITNKNIGKLGIYKPSAGVTPKGIFYLYYTAQDADNRDLNKLFMTTIDFAELIRLIG